MSIIEDIRRKLVENKLDAYVITHGNRYLGQDILSAEHKLKMLCGFSGSAGIAAVTKDKVYLLVDGRYELQARQETDAGLISVQDMMPRLKNVCDVLKEDGVLGVGYDAWCHSAAEMEFIKRRYADMEFSDVGCWLEMPAKQTVKVLERDIKFSGQSREEKIAMVQDLLQLEHAAGYLFTSADSVSWLMNIYSRDLPYSPVVRAYALVEQNGAVTLYGDNLNADLPCGNWDDFARKLQSFGENKLLYDAHLAPEKVKTLLSGETKIYKAPDICQLLKAEKNPTEMQGMINCHIRDGVALSKFLCWLEDNHNGISELDVVAKLHEFRAAQEYFFSESFATIAGAAENGAIVHYQPSELSNRLLQNNSLLLIDSGGQYLDGTTDVTRTIALGTPTEDMIRDFTTVLKAHIALAMALFPAGTSGMKLDVLAREPLWKRGLDYKHGTGHGVACFGNVHEAPVSISSGGSDYALKSGNVTSDEPGIYRENLYGIRIENLLSVCLAPHSGFLQFNTLTKVPIDKRLIDKYMLDTGEQAWLDDYHQSVYNCLAPYMNEKEKLWLKDACSPL